MFGALAMVASGVAPNEARDDWDDDWLWPDSPAEIAATTQPPDNSEWNQGDDAPTWMEVDAASYRGGGVMGRRRGRRPDE